MTSYTFVCIDCGRIFRKEMSITMYTATSMHTCPHCKSTSTRRFFTDIPTVVYKDDGFTKHIKEG
jgi:putative FmdB family regulatory protein